MITLAHFSNTVKPLTLVFLTLGSHLSSAQELQSILTFTDKTHISGQTLSLNPHKNTLHFKAPSLQENAHFKTGRLLDIALKGKPNPVEADHYALATIKGHHNDSHRDTLRGRLIDLDEKTITLDTWYAGKLTLKRSLVHALDIFSQSPTFFTGPNGPDGWVTSNGKVEDSWTFKHRSMTSKSQRVGIAHKVQIPERSKITVTARWKNSPYFSILFLSNDETSHYPTSGYALNIQQSRLTLSRNTPEHRNNIFDKPNNSLLEIEQATITIYLDRTTDGTNAVYIDDKRISTWSDVDDTLLKGEWLHFVPNRNSPMKLSNISVSQWDGSLPLSIGDDPAQQDLTTTAPKLEGQEIRLANGDIVIGNIKDIDKQLLHLSTSFGDVKVPLRLMRSIILSEVEDEDRMEQNDIRAWFHEGGYVTIKLKSFDGKTIKGYSQVYGDAEFQINAFSRIQFNIWDRKLDPARLRGDLDDW